MMEAINAEVSSKTNENGIARIKPEFLILDRERKISLEYVSKLDKEKLLKDSTQDSLEPPKKKLRGRNKHRPRDAHYRPEDKMCPNIIREEECPYGDKCHYLHDVQIYWQKRPLSLHRDCYLFEQYGKCPFGVSCMFATKHLAADNKNVTKDASSICSQLKSILSKDLQFRLRKQRYDFERANNNIKAISAFMKFKQDSKTSGSNDLPDSRIGDSAGSEKVLSQIEDTNGISEVELNTRDEVLTVTEQETKVKHNCNSLDCFVRNHHDMGKMSGAITDEDHVRLNKREIKTIDFAGKLYLAPLTTVRRLQPVIQVGNLPFRRICKRFGADITCGEMAMAYNLLIGQQSEWALLKRHESEDIFGVQICGAHPDQMTRCAQLVTENVNVDFIDINVGCPIDIVYQRGAGCGLMGRNRKFEEIVYGMRSVMDVPLTVKIRTGIYEKKKIAHMLIPKLKEWGVTMTALHGRSREQRYTKCADWDYIGECAKIAEHMSFFGCGDVLSYEEVNHHLKFTDISGVMIARGALIKPWIFTEIKEQRHWDISSKERLDILQDFVNFGLEHWGSDYEGVERTRKFLLEWLSFLYRYIPVGILERVPVKINERPPFYRGRDDLETLFASPHCADWVKISEMLLGPVPNNFSFLPKHKANSYG